jgi:tetratricopeptide (TPR) repeat protein
LFQQTLYDESSGALLLRLHRQLGEAIESVHGVRQDPCLPALAAHFVACAADGSPEKGIHYSIEAGRQATQQVAYGEAVDHFQDALRLLESSPSVNTAQHIELLLHLAEALRCDGQTSEARATNLRAAAIARAVGEYELHARAALGIAVNENEVSVDDDAAADTLQLALDLLPGEATITRASLLASLSWVLMLHDPNSLDRRRQLSEEAVSLARSNGDPAALAEALYGWMYAFWEPTETERFLDTMDQILRLAIESGNNRMALIMHSLRFSDLLMLGQIEAAEAELAAYKELAIQLRLPYNLWSVAFKEAMLAIMRGRYEEAERLVEETYQIGARVAPMSAEPLYIMQRFALAREHGGLEQLEDALAGFMDDNLLSARFERCLLALLYCETGRANDARAHVEHIVGDGLATIPGDQFWLGTLTLLADIYLSLDDLERCRDLYDLLGPYAGQIARSGTSVICVGPVSLALGRLAAALGEPEAAIAHLEEAIESSQRIGALPFAAYAQLALADVLRESGRHEHAAQHLDNCRIAARELGMPRLASLLDKDTPRTIGAELLSGR